MEEEITYQKAGVSIGEADAAKKEIAAYLKQSDARILNEVGPFALLFSATFPTIEEPVLVLKAEEPGSKQLLALKYGRLRGIAYDLVNHLINDIIVMGATPLAVLDTVICGKLEKTAIVQIVKSIADACVEQSCDLVGGEISEQPGVIPPGQVVLCASIVGVVDKPKIIDGSRITEGDLILGLASNGLHTNGYSLVRYLINNNSALIEEMVGSMTFLDVILQPHLCYYKGLRSLFSIPELHGLAHITGGGIGANLTRILPQGLNASINLDQIHLLPVFKHIRDAGKIPESEMLRTFNMGVGMTLIAPPSAISEIQKCLSKDGYSSNPIGEITQGNKAVEFHGKLCW